LAFTCTYHLGEPRPRVSLLGIGAILVGSRALMAAHVISPLELSRRAADAGSEVLVARNGQFLGTIFIGDTLRPEAQRAIASLGRLGIQSILLTGDSSAVANAVVGQLGINQIETELLPEAKLARIKKLVADGFVVAMVGDGINDAPALAEANVLTSVSPWVRAPTLPTKVAMCCCSATT